MAEKKNQSNSKSTSRSSSRNTKAQQNEEMNAQQNEQQQAGAEANEQREQVKLQSEGNNASGNAFNKPLITQTEVNNADKTQLVPDQDRENLSESELRAVEMQEQAIAGAAAVRYVRLKNPSTQYTDTVNNWSLTGDEVKELPNNPSAETLERIKYGFIVETTAAPGAAASGNEDGDGEPPQPADPEDGEVTIPVEGPAEIVDPEKEN